MVTYWGEAAPASEAEVRFARIEAIVRLIEQRKMERLKGPSLPRLAPLFENPPAGNAASPGAADLGLST